MPQDFTFSLIAPESKIMEGPVALATLPGEMGEFGVGANHVPLIASLAPGVVHIKGDYAAQKPDAAWFITGGYAEIDGTHCTVLANAAESMADLSVTDVRQKLKNLEEDLTLYEEPTEQRRVKREIRLMQARLRAIEHFAKTNT